MSNPIYVNAGTVTINYSYRLTYDGRAYPVQDQASGLLVFGASGDLLATVPIVLGYFGVSKTGIATWEDPVSQYSA